LGGVLLAVLLLGRAAPASAQDDFGFSTITLYAPGAPAGAWVSVQWQDGAGTWRDVAGWQSAIDSADDSSLRYKQLAVYPRDYGRGPFRWVVSTTQGGAVWATSDSFYLPDGDGAALATTLVAAGGAGGPTAEPGVMPVNYSTITLHAPDAPVGAAVDVQWRDETGAWHNVEGWQGQLATSAETGEPFIQWGVHSKDYGRGPFRWVISHPQTEAVIATSPRFFLPTGDGANLSMSVLPKIVAAPADEIIGGMNGEPATLDAQTSTMGLNCGAAPCNSVISVSVPDTMAGSLVGVQWQDPFGLWHDVPTWQGTLTMSENRSTPYQQWAISPELQGRGPFRWVIYNPLGDAVLGVTPSFTLPDRSGINLNMTVPADFSDIAG
jgi:hypothetical protein